MLPAFLLVPSPDSAAPAEVASWPQKVPGMATPGKEQFGDMGAPLTPLLCIFCVVCGGGSKHSRTMSYKTPRAAVVPVSEQVRRTRSGSQGDFGVGVLVREHWRKNVRVRRLVRGYATLGDKSMAGPGPSSLLGLLHSCPFFCGDRIMSKWGPRGTSRQNTGPCQLGLWWRV